MLIVRLPPGVLITCPGVLTTCSFSADAERQVDGRCCRGMSCARRVYAGDRRRGRPGIRVDADPGAADDRQWAAAATAAAAADSRLCG